MPFLLKSQWHLALMPVVSAWAGGVELEPTALYGMRIYREGSWLTRHVDREDTHALSAIMNLDQSSDVEPWPLVIDSVAGQTHELTVAPGEMLFYESARCLHGRPKPLRGRYFVNAFVHFRPRGRPAWYKEYGSFSGAAVAWAAEHVQRRSEEARELARRLAAPSGLAGWEDRLEGRPRELEELSVGTASRGADAGEGEGAAAGATAAAHAMPSLHAHMPAASLGSMSPRGPTAGLPPSPSVSGAVAGPGSELWALWLVLDVLLFSALLGGLLWLLRRWGVRAPHSVEVRVRSVLWPRDKGGAE